MYSLFSDMVWARLWLKKNYGKTKGPLTHEILGAQYSSSNEKSKFVQLPKGKD